MDLLLMELSQFVENLIRNVDGVFLFRCSCNLGACTIIMAELWTIYKGMQTAKDHKFIRIEVNDLSLVMSLIWIITCIAYFEEIYIA
jgi:hypothetical protein